MDMVHTFNPSVKKTEAMDPCFLGSSGLYSEFQASQGYPGRPCLNNKTKQNKISVT